MANDIEQLLNRAVDGLKPPPDIASRAVRGFRQSRRRRTTVVRACVAVTSAAAIVSVTVLAVTGSSDSTTARLVPANGPSSPVASPELSMPPVSKTGVIPAEERVKAPDLNAPTSDGNGTVRLKNFQGQVVVVAFFASWNSHSRVLMPELNRAFAESDAAQGSLIAHPAVVGLSIRDSDAGLRAFLDAYNVRFPVINDAEGTISREWGLPNGPPYVVVVDAEGRIAARLEDTTSAALTTAVNAVIATTAADGLVGPMPVASAPSAGPSLGVQISDIVDRWLQAPPGPAQNKPFLQFDAKGTWQGSDGCNVMGGEWGLDAVGIIRITPTGATTKECSAGTFASLAGSYLTFESGRLLLVDRGGRALATYAREVEPTGSNQPTRQPSAIPYVLLTHCGIDEARLGDDYYEAVTPLNDGNGNTPEGWNSWVQAGVMTVTSTTTAVFTDDQGHRVEFRQRRGATGFKHVCQ